MVFSKAFALAAIFATLTAAAPVNQKRAVVYETVTEIDVTTIDTTITLYPGQPTPSPVVFTTEVPVATTTPAPQAPVSTPPAVAAASPAPAPPVEPKPSPIEAPAAPATTVVPTTTAAPPPPPPPAPTTTTQAPPPPPPAPTPSTTTTAAPAPTPAAPSGGSTGGSGGPSGSGAGTYYDTATSMSAPSFCDTANDGLSENVVALSVDIMSQALCGKSITITHNGKTSTGIVVDKCMGCAAGDVDMSRHMFGELADLSAGRIPITWSL